MIVHIQTKSNLRAAIVAYTQNIYRLSISDFF